MLWTKKLLTVKKKHQYKKRSKFMISKSNINTAKKQINDC